MGTRLKSIPEATKQEILLKSKRRCPICFTEGDRSPREGSIAMIDHGVGNIDRDNLVFLCMEHHTGFDRGELSAKQVRSARDRLYTSITSEAAAVGESGAESRAFEERVVDHVRSQFAQRFGDNFALFKNPLYPGRSGVSHEVDLATEFSIEGIRYLTIFEIKHRKRILGLQEILEFAGRAADIRADKAVLICNGPVSASAARLARDQRISLLQGDTPHLVAVPTEPES